MKSPFSLRRQIPDSTPITVPELKANRCKAQCLAVKRALASKQTGDSQ